MSSFQRELVLTGLTDFWPEDETVAIFLGPWCFAHNEKHAYCEYVDFSVASSPFDSTEKTVRACHYVGSLCDRIIPDLALSLNRLHETDHSEPFWKVATICWLLHWVGACYDRYQRLRHVHHLYSDEQLLHVKLLPERDCGAGDWSDFSYKLSGHVYNLQLMSDIIRESRQFDTLRSTVCSIADSCPQPRRRHWDDVPARSGSHWIDRLSLFLLSRGHPQCLLGSIPGVSRWDKLVIRFHLDPFFALRRKHLHSSSPSTFVSSPNRTDMTLDFDARDDFEAMIARILPAYLPDSLMTCGADVNPYGRPPTLWIGNDVYGGAERTYRIAHTVEAGGKWISAQHGGGYGQILEVGHGKIEYEVSDGFVTWGWTNGDSSAATLYPLPSPSLSQLPRHFEKNNRLILVGTMVPAYHYRFHSLTQPEQILDVLQWRKRFLTQTSASIRKHTWYRPYAIDYGVDETGFVMEANPECKLLRGSTLAHELSRARLAVVDHVATTLLQTLVMNVPTVLFWNPTVYILHPGATRLFDELRSVGVLFDSPEDAADQVNAVWSDVAGWWTRVEIQDARRHFVDRFARTSKHWRREWIAFLKSQLRRTADRSVRTITTSRRVVS